MSALFWKKWGEGRVFCPCPEIKKFLFGKTRIYSFRIGNIALYAHRRKMMRTYLVTGGAGFIGSNYIHYMFRKYGNEIRIINVDCLTYAGNL